MALSAPRSLFGVHSVSFYNRSSGQPYGMLRVLGGSSINQSGELAPLNGGSSKYAWHVEGGLITTELSLTFREYPNFLFELFLGKAPTAVSAEASGNVSSLTAKTGSIENATTGIASIAAESGQEAELKFGKYLVVAASATTVNIYCLTDADFARGTDEVFEDDTLKINASPLTVSDTGGTTSITNFGLEITGGSGTVAMTTSDSATFEVRPIHAGGATTVTVGASADTYPEFGAVCMAKKRSNEELFEVDLFRCKAIGMPIGFEENAWGEAAVTAQAFYDSAQDGVFSVRHVKPLA